MVIKRLITLLSTLAIVLSFSLSVFADSAQVTPTLLDTLTAEDSYLAVDKDLERNWLVRTVMQDWHIDLNSFDSPDGGIAIVNGIECHQFKDLQGVSDDKTVWQFPLLEVTTHDRAKYAILQFSSENYSSEAKITLSKEVMSQFGISEIGSDTYKMLIAPDTLTDDQWDSILRTAEFTTTDALEYSQEGFTSDSQITIMLFDENVIQGPAADSDDFNLIYNSNTKHFYMNVTGKSYSRVDKRGKTHNNTGITWDQARQESLDSYLKIIGQYGYLATTSSEDEWKFIQRLSEGFYGYLGGTRGYGSKVWYWADGPEAGQAFSELTYTPANDITWGHGAFSNNAKREPYSVSVNGQYNAWGSKQPDSWRFHTLFPLGGEFEGSSAQERYLHIDKSGQWNDYPNDSWYWWEHVASNDMVVESYLIEFGGLGPNRVQNTDSNALVSTAIGSSSNQYFASFNSPFDSEKGFVEINGIKYSYEDCWDAYTAVDSATWRFTNPDLYTEDQVNAITIQVNSVSQDSRTRIHALTVLLDKLEIEQSETSLTLTAKTPLTDKEWQSVIASIKFETYDPAIFEGDHLVGDLEISMSVDVHPFDTIYAYTHAGYMDAMDPFEIRATWSQQPVEKDTLIVESDSSNFITGYAVTLTSEAPDPKSDVWQESPIFKDVITDNTVYYVWARNISDQICSTTADVKTLDIYAPKITNVEIPSDWSPTKTIQVIATDNTSPYDPLGSSGLSMYALTTEPQAPTEGWDGNTRFAITQNGIYYAWAKDKLGHVSQPYKFEIATLDTDPPTQPILTVIGSTLQQSVQERVPVNFEVKFTASGSESQSGIKAYEYRFGNNGPVHQLPVVEQETITIPNTETQVTNVLSATSTLDYTTMIYVRAVSNSGLTSDWTTFAFQHDSLAPIDGVITPSTKEYTTDSVELTFTAQDAPATSTDVMSGVKDVRLVGDAWTLGSELTVEVNDNGTYVFEARDVAGNVAQFSYTVNNIDTVPANIWIEDPTYKHTSYGLDHEWTNEPVQLTLNGQDITPPDPPSGVYRMTTPNQSVIVESDGESLHTLDYIATQNGTYSFAVSDVAGNESAIDYDVWNIDKVAPNIEWTEDVRYYEGKSIIYIIASDDLSGVDYILMPDGVTRVYADELPLDQGYEPGDPTPKLFFRYEITMNDAYTFTIFDRAGNFVSKTFEYYDLRHDYAIKPESFVIKDTVAANSNIRVSATLQNYDGPGKAVSAQVYYMDDEQKVILAYDNVDIPKATKDGPGEFNWEANINLEDNIDIQRLYIAVGSELLHLDLHPENNIDSVSLDPYPFNYAIAGLYQDEFVTPGQNVMIPVQISGTGLGDTQTIPVELSLGGQLISRSFVYIGEENNPVNTTLQGIIPANADHSEVEILARVNWDNRELEANTEDNEWSMGVFSQTSDLSLLITGENITDSPVKLTSDAPQGTFTYPAEYETYNLTFMANDPNEKIVQVTTLGRVFNQQDREYSTNLKIGKGQTQTFEVVVESATGDLRCAYNITVIHGNDDIDVDVEAKLPDSRIFEGQQTSEDVYEIHLPINSESYYLNLAMHDKDARIVAVDGTPVDESDYSQLKSITPGSTNTHFVTVMSQDGLISRTFEVRVSTENQSIHAEIVNKSEIDGTIYGLGGILRDDRYIPYGNDITDLEIAHRAGRTNGVILQIRVSDLNLDQYARGYVQLPNSEVYYNVHWNTFDGPQIMQVADIDFGYVYIDRTALRSDMNIQDVTLTVWDQATDSEADSPLTQATCKVKFGVDVTAPVITATSSEVEDGEPKGSVTYSTIDSFTGVNQVSYRYSTDNGRTWSEDRAVPSNGKITLDDVYGDIVVELTADDLLRNSNQLMVPLSVTSPDVAVTASIYLTTNHVSDVAYINGRSSNADGISREILDTFS